MKKIILIAAVLLLAGLLAGAEALAQHGQGHGMHHPSYDAATVETLIGVVARVDSMKMADHVGIHLMLKTGAETIEVHLGPSWFLDRQDDQIGVGDAVEVTGSRIMIGEVPALLAREVKKGAATLVLRDAQGLPVWRGWRRN